MPSVGVARKFPGYVCKSWRVPSSGVPRAPMDVKTVKQRAHAWPAVFSQSTGIPTVAHGVFPRIVGVLALGIKSGAWEANNKKTSPCGVADTEKLEQRKTCTVRSVSGTPVSKVCTQQF